MKDDIAIERALIEALLGQRLGIAENSAQRWLVRGSSTCPEIAWSIPGVGKYAEYGPWRMYPNRTSYGVISGFDNIIVKLRDPVLRMAYGLPPLDEPE